MTALAGHAGPPGLVAVGVVVPARDEQDRIARCLASLRRALAHVPDGVATAVAVVLDRCTDATPERVARRCSADWPRRRRRSPCDDDVPRGVVHGDRADGAGRRPGGSGRRRPARPRASALSWTGSPVTPRPGPGCSAPTPTPRSRPTGSLAHLRQAADGVHAVAGLADLVGDDHLADGRRWRATARSSSTGCTAPPTATSTARTSASAPTRTSPSAASRPTARARTTGCGSGSPPPATRSRSPSASGCGRAPGCAAVPTAGSPGSCARCTATVTTPTR